ncbi:MAG: ASPIC/UnbV domain-containing protein [Acidobacteriia bacterium]|nr:ASPIC/UnbV domain-containing protein [Terriglobia bacterium]
MPRGASCLLAEIRITNQGTAAVNSTTSDSYLSVNDRRLHFGLGAETVAGLEIRWPNGRKEKIEEVAADQLVVVREGAGTVRRESFSPRRP